MLRRSFSSLVARAVSSGTIGVLATLGAIAACSNFGTAGSENADTSANGTDAQAGDASTPTDAAAEGSAPADAGCTATFCEGFDDDGWNERWADFGIDLPTAGSLNVDGIAFVSAPRSLVVEVGKAQTSRYLSRDIGLARRTVAKTKILVAQTGAGEVDLFGITGFDATKPDNGVLLVERDGAYVLETPNTGQSTPLPMLTSWTDVTIEAEYNSDQTELTCRLTVAPVADPSQAVTRTLVWTSAPSASSPRRALRVGALWTAPDRATVGWQFRFDDVTLEVTP